MNWNGYSNPKVDKLFAQADAEKDVPKRDALYLQGAKVAFDDFAFVPIAEVYDVQVFPRQVLRTSTAFPRCRGRSTSGPSVRADLEGE